MRNFVLMVLFFFLIFLVTVIESSESESSEAGFINFVDFLFCTAVDTIADFLNLVLAALLSFGLSFCVVLFVFRGKSVKLVLCKYVVELSDFACFSLKIMTLHLNFYMSFQFHHIVCKSVQNGSPMKLVR